MAFATDRDLLVLEPNLYRDVVFSAQKLVSSDGVALSGTTLTDASADFVGSGVAEGHVALVGSLPVEVVERINPTSLSVSLVRARPADEAVPPGDVTDAALTICTFRPQLEVIERQLLQTLGISPEATANVPHAGQILNPEALRAVEAYGALELIFSSAASLVMESATLWAKARLYRQRYALERQRVAVHLDTNGYGKTNLTRRINTVQLLRN